MTASTFPSLLPRNRCASPAATSAYEKKTGLHMMSEPRRLNSHAIWSRAERIIASAKEEEETADLTLDSLLDTDSPARETGWAMTAFWGIGGRVGHMASTRLRGRGTSVGGLVAGEGSERLSFAD